MNDNYIYGAYKEVPKQYYLKDGVYKEYIAYFESELDCIAFCVMHNYMYDCIYVQPAESAPGSIENLFRSKTG